MAEIPTVVEHRLLKMNNFIVSCACDPTLSRSADDYTQHLIDVVDTKHEAKGYRLADRIVKMTETLGEMSSRFENIENLVHLWTGRAKHIRETIETYPEEIRESLMETALDFEARARDVINAASGAPVESGAEAENG